MESPFIYDLATIRNPRSAFSYTNYLLARSRLVEFANSDRLNPLRLEFEDYVSWCAGQFADNVSYSSEVVAVTPEKTEGIVRWWNVGLRDEKGQTRMVQAKSIVAPSPSDRRGKTLLPLTSIDFLAGQRIVAASDYQARRNELRKQHERRLNIAVVGSSQQSVEILDDLLSCPRLGNVIMVTENEALAPLRILHGEQEPPAPPALCSLWARPSSDQTSTLTEAPERVQDIYSRAYEKQVASKGEYRLRVVIGRDTAEACSKADIVIAEEASDARPNNGLFHGIDALVVGCRHKGESLEEVQFKRGAVAGDCRMWMVSARSQGGRSLAKDIAARAGDVVRTLAEAADGDDDVRVPASYAARM